MVNNLIILPEIRENLLPLKDEELKALEKSVITEGIRDELIAWDKDNELVLVDGHHRYDLAQKHNLEFKINKRQFSNLEEVLEWIDNNQLGRRNLTNEERSYLIGRMYLREQKQWGGNRRNQGDNLSPCSGSHATARSIAGKVGVNEKTVRRAGDFAEAVDKVKQISPEVAERILKGEVNDALTQLPQVTDILPEVVEKLQTCDKIANAIREARREEIIQELDKQLANIENLELPNRVYDVIVIDPPWPIEKIERDVAPNQVKLDYPTMDKEELINLSIPAAENCHVWLWTIQKYLPFAFELLKAWEMKYVCTFVWHKSGGFQPVELPQYNCEFVLYARIGSPKFIDTKNFFTCFEAPRGKHSEKPEEFYDMVRRVTAGRRLDMFARRKIEGFDGWGLEA